LPGSSRLPYGVGLQRSHVPPPVAALGGNCTSPLYQFRCSVGLVSGHGGVPPCPGSTRLPLGVSGSVARARYAHTLRFYITPHFVKCSPVAALKLRLVSPTALRPPGFTKQALCKVACARGGRTAIGASRSVPALRTAVWCPVGWLWHLGIGQALRAGLLAPAHPCGLAAARHWPCAGLPVRPPRGLPQPSARGHICAHVGLLFNA